MPHPLLERRENRFRDKARAGGIDVLVANFNLVVSVETLRNYDIELVLGPRHCHVKQPALLFDFRKGTRGPIGSNREGSEGPMAGVEDCRGAGRRSGILGTNVRCLQAGDW
jgi:hypothetical protein